MLWWRGWCFEFGGIGAIGDPLGDSSPKKNATKPIYFLFKNEGGMLGLLFFVLVGLYDVEEQTYNTEVVQVDDGIFYKGKMT